VSTVNDHLGTPLLAAGADIRYQHGAITRA
jgi:hypothetical protein